MTIAALRRQNLTDFGFGARKATRNLRVIKWLGTNPRRRDLHFLRQFVVPMTALRKVADAQESLRAQFAEPQRKRDDAS